MVLAKNTSIGVSKPEMETIDRMKGTKTRAQHIRDNAMAYNPQDIDIVYNTGKDEHVKTSFFPVEEHIIRKKLEESALDFGTATKSSNYHNYLRCVAQMPAKDYAREDIEQHIKWDRVVKEEKMTYDEIAKLVEALM